MIPGHVRVRERGHDLPRSHKGSVSDSQDAPGDLTEARESNPWASEPGDDWLTATLRNQHRSTTRPRETSGSTNEANLRLSRWQRITKAGSSPGKRTRSSQDIPNVKSYGPHDRLSWEADSEMSHSSGSHSENADAFPDSSVNSRLAHDKLVYQIQRLQERLASLQHDDTNSDNAGDRSASAKKPWKVLHEVQCTNFDSPTCYLDEPELESEHELGHLHWQGTKRVSNVKAWIRKQRQPFIVYRQYHCVHQREEVSEPREKVRILSDDLDSTLWSWLAESPGLSIYGNEGAYVDNEMEAPYLCFYHFRYEARQLLSASGSLSGSSSQASQATLHLLEYLEWSTAEITHEAEKVFASGKVTAKLMPYLFKPGALVCFEEFGDSVVCEQTSLLIMSSRDGDIQRRSYELSTVRIAFDGKFRRLRPFTHRIDFRAAKDEPLYIADLSIQPLSSISSERRAELKRRGETFMRCQKQLYVTYPSRGGHEDFVDTRFMVDVEAYHMLHDKEASAASNRDPPISESSIDSLKGTEEFLLQLPPTIVGFNMTEKKWIQLQVSEIKEVEWSPQTFRSVEIEPGSKELIEALVRNKIERDEGIDFVRGKGTGLVVLLHGGPGTGKTLTAEGVAEIAKKPLYRVTGGDVGTDPRAVERYLESVFKLGKRWNCVVLLDEADVFLEQRSFANLERNALVSVFLRVIEYYDGILILTSNRVGTFDEAFKSRIQLALHFSNLDADRRAKIWAKFIDRLAEVKEDVDFDDVNAHLQTLAQQLMNGRQIRNAVTTARQLARFRKKKLNYSHLKQAIDVSQKFEEYVREVKGGDDDEIAEQDMLRLRGK